MSRRTIALLTVGSTPRHPQGVADYTTSLAEALAASEFEILVWTQRHRESKADSFRPRRGLPIWRPGMFAGADLWRQLRRTRPDLLHVQFEFGIYGGALGLASVLLALWLARVVLRQRTVVTIHQVPSPRDLTKEWLRRSGVWLPTWAGRRAVGLTFAALRKSSERFIVLAAVFGERLRAEWGIPHPIAVVPHGVTVNGHRRSSDEPRLLLFGYLKWYKGIEIAIEAFGRLAGEFPEWTLTIAGPAASEAYLETLRRLARPLGSRVEFLGPIKEEFVEDLFRRTGIVLLPYRTLFSASGPLAQAISHETPFVISEALRSLCPSWPLWAGADPEGWVRALRPLMRDQKARASARRLAAAFARQWDWPAIAESTRRVYRAMVS